MTQILKWYVKYSFFSDFRSKYREKSTERTVFMKKKVLSLIVAIVMVLTMLPVMGLATDTPPAVTITSISYADGAVSLAWQAQDGVDGYRVYRKTGSGKWTTVLSSTTGTSYTDTTVTEGKTYSYTLRSNVGSAWSTGYNDTAKTITVKATVEPQPVTITSISYADGAVSLAWQGQDSVDGYRIYRKTGSGKWITIVASTTDTSYTDTTVTEGKTYSYTLRSNVGSAWSTGYNDTAKTITAKAAVEPQPVTITTIDYADGAVSLAWQGQDGVEGYRIYRKTGSGKWITIVASTTDTSFTDTTVTEGKTYSYTLRSNVGSAWSTGYNDTAKTITAKAAVEPQPVTITSISYVDGAVSLAWQGQDGVDGYRIYRKTGSGKWTTIVASTTDTSFTDTTVTEGKTYSYTLRSNVGSTWSTGYNDTAKTIKVPSAVPDDVNISMITQSTEGGIIVSWDAVPSADGYRVYRKTANASWKTVLSNTTDTTFTDTNANVGVTYYYTIRSVKNGVWSTGYNDTVKSFAAGTAGLGFNQYTGMISCADEDIREIYIPAVINGVKVKGIEANGFSGCKNLTTVTVLSGTQDLSIGAYAFENCTALSKVDFRDVITSIGEYAFKNCTALNSVDLPTSLKNISKKAFSGCVIEKLVVTGNGSFGIKLNSIGLSSIKELEIKKGVTGIGYGAFRGCDSLTSVTIPESVMSIGKNAFMGCSGLKSVTIPPSVTKISDYAFSGCSGLTSVTIPAEVTTIDTGVFQDCSGLASVIVPEGITSLGERAFYGCTGLTLVTIPSSVTSIGAYAFGNCTSLPIVTIPEGVTSIGTGAFSNCSSLTSVTIPSSVTSIGKYIFSGCSALNSVIIPEGVISIGNHAFDGCGGLTEVTIPSSVAKIGDYAFNGCSRLVRVNISDLAAWCCITIGDISYYPDLDRMDVDYASNPLSYAHHLYIDGKEVTNLIIPEGVYSINYNTFSGCSGLTSLTLSSSVTSIGDKAFYDCSGITSLTIPASVTSIGKNAFVGIKNIETISIPKDVNSDIVSLVNGCTKLTDIYYGGSKAQWANIRSKFKDSVIDNARLHYAEAYPVTGGNIYFDKAAGAITYYEGNITSLVIPEKIDGVAVCSIDRLVFKGCGSLMSVTIPASVTSIGTDAFYGCSKLETINVNGKNPVFASYDGVLFTKNKKEMLLCPNARSGSYTVPKGVTNIGEAFRNCKSLTSVIIPEGVNSIAIYAFRGCWALTSVTIPKSVMNIGANAFLDCKKITNVYYGGDESGWDRIKENLEEWVDTETGERGQYDYGEHLPNATIHYNSAN